MGGWVGAWVRGWVVAESSTPCEAGKKVREKTCISITCCATGTREDCVRVVCDETTVGCRPISARRRRRPPIIKSIEK